MSIEKYVKKVVPEHRKPKFLEWLKANLRKVDDAECLLLEIDSAFDIDKAIGEQLDVTGQVIGREREVDFEPPLGISPILDDEIYRVLQKAKISINQWNGTVPSLWELWETLFPQYAFVLYDNQNMTLNLYIMGETTPMEWELFSRGYIAPKPEGVRIRYEFVLPTVEIDSDMYEWGHVLSDIRSVSVEQEPLDEPGTIESAVYVTGLATADKRFFSLDQRTVGDFLIDSHCHTSMFTVEVARSAILTDPLGNYLT